MALLIYCPPASPPHEEPPYKYPVAVHLALCSLFQLLECLDLTLRSVEARYRCHLDELAFYKGSCLGRELQLHN